MTTRASQTGQDDHQLTLARLEAELQERIKLADVLSQHEVLNGENLENIRKKQELLARLRSSMTSVLESLSPMTVDFALDADPKTSEASDQTEETMADVTEQVKTTPS